MFSARVLVILLVFVAFIVPARAEDGNVQAQYDAMVARSYDMPQGYDFAKLRALYQKLPTYKPYSLHPVRNYKKLVSDINKNPTDEVRLVDAYVRRHFAMHKAHFYVLKKYKEMQNNEKEVYHWWMVRGLKLALNASGDGRTAETAYKVISVDEEYDLARMRLQKDTIHQSLEHKDGRVYDVLSGKNKDTGEDMDMWFDITHIYGTATKE